jgi:hypothetical protein
MPTWGIIFIGYGRVQKLKESALANKYQNKIMQNTLNKKNKHKESMGSLEKDKVLTSTPHLEHLANPNFPNPLIVVDPRILPIEQQQISLMLVVGTRWMQKWCKSGEVPL